MLDREKIVAQCEWAIRQTSPTIIESKTFYEEVLALLKDDETQLQYRDDHIAMYQAEIKRLETLLKEQEADMIALKNAYKELAEKGSVIVRCKECKHFYKDDFGLPICMEHKKLWIKDNWFCADGVKKE